MFWRKNKPAEVVPGPAVSVSTIPEEFYGGASPQVVFSSSPVKKHFTPPPKPALTPARPTPPPLRPPEKKALDQATAVGAGDIKHPVNALSNQRTFLMILAIVFVLGILGGVIYYFILTTKHKPEPLPPVPVATPTPEPTPTPVSEPTTTPDNTVSSTTSADNTTPFTVAPSGLAISADSDNDGLTDIEEDLFKTDPNVADSDHDGYPDSHEVYNLYNPIGKEPQKISDSGLVTPFVNPTVGYQVYRPNSWAVGNVDQDFQDVLFSTFTGEYVRIKTFTKDPSETFENFLTRIAPGERVGDYQPFSSRFKESGHRRNDYLVYVFLRGSIGMVISYEVPPESSVVNYPTVVKMMARSFSWQQTAGDLPAQVIESGASTSTGSGL